MRYADEQAKKNLDFKPRNRMPSVLQFALIFCGLYGLLMAYFLISSNTIGFAVWLFVLLAGLTALIVYILKFSNDLVFATEFQNAMFANALGISYVFSIITRDDGSIVYVDRGLQDFFKQYSRTRHKNLVDFFAIANVSESHQNAIMHSLQSFQQERILCTMTQDDGNKRELVLSVDPIVKPGNFHLIRARLYSEKRSENASENAAVKYDLAKSMLLLSQKLPIGIFSADAKGLITYANANFESYIGYQPGELTASHTKITQIIPDPQKVFGGGETEGFVTFRHKQGGVIRLYAISHLEDVNGVMSGMGAVVYPPDYEQDEKKKSSIDHAASAAYAAPSATATLPVASAEAFLDAAPIAIMQTDAKGNITYVNKAFRTLVGRTEGDIPARLTDLVPALKQDEANQLMQQVLHGAAGHSHMQMELALPGGAPVSVSIYANRSTTEQGGTFYLVDVSEQKNLELRFAHSQKMQAVGQLAGGVAHDFNNLLTAMIGFCDLLLMRHPAGDQSFADIMQIKQNANRAANLVRQLLAFSRRQTLQPKNLDITDVLAELSNLIRRLIGENIELKMIHGRDLDMVKADQGQLEQVIINLAVNARDAMKDGGTLTIKSSKAKIDKQHSIPRQLMAPAGEEGVIPDGEYILIEIADTGTGIPHSVMSKIFEPFFSTKEIGSGTGLGLSTVYGIIKQTGGYIYVASAENKGTQFNIYFPAHAVVESEKPQLEAEERPGQDLTGRETLLLVEDETPVRAFASRALRNKGYTVYEADCAETALDLVREHGGNLDLIVTDVIMPGMNGPTMVDKISVEYPDIKVIFISGYAEDIFMHNYGSERSFNFLAKPFTLKQLASKVKDVTSQK